MGCFAGLTATFEKQEDERGKQGGRKRGRERGQGELYQQTPDQPQSGDLLVLRFSQLVGYSTTHFLSHMWWDAGPPDDKAGRKKEQACKDWRMEIIPGQDCTRI